MVDGPARLEDYALLGDCQSAALVSREGSIDWWCVPRFDSGACFAALLGTADHGRFLIAPVATRAVEPPLPRGHDGARDRARHADRSRPRARLPGHGPERPLLVRVVKGLSGEVPMRVELVVRFDYGSIVPWVRTVDGVWSAIGGPDGLALRTSVELRGEDLKTVGEFTVARREQVSFVLGWFPSHDPEPVPRNGPRSFPARRSTGGTGRRGASYTGQWREPVLRSLLTLESLTFERDRRASSPRPPPRCPRRSAGRATGTTATAGCATRRSRSRR